MAAVAAVIHGDRSLAGPRGSSREAVRHSATTPEVATAETVPCTRRQPTFGPRKTGGLPPGMDSGCVHNTPRH
jgi:hypothetical protein